MSYTSSKDDDDGLRRMGDNGGELGGEQGGDDGVKVGEDGCDMSGGTAWL